MKNFRKNELIRQSLNELSKEDFVAQAIIYYYDYLDMKMESIKNGELTKEEFVEFYNSYKKLINLLNEVLPEELKKNNAKVNDLVSLYILNNFIRLCPSNSLKRYYERILNLKKRLSKNFSLTMQLAIILRSAKILKKICVKYDNNAAVRFLNFLEASRESEDELLYIIYYGLFDGTIINNHLIDNGKKVQNEIVEEALLDCGEKLPDSIIMHLCNDEQFKEYDPQVVLFLIQRFFMFRQNVKLPDDDMLDIIQKIFNNNVRVFDTEAEFLDLSSLMENVVDYFNGSLKDNEFYTHFLEVVNGIETLDRREDKPYGSI